MNRAMAGISSGVGLGKSLPNPESWGCLPSSMWKKRRQKQDIIQLYKLLEWVSKKPGQSASKPSEVYRGRVFRQNPSCQWSILKHRSYFELFQVLCRGVHRLVDFLWICAAANTRRSLSPGFATDYDCHCIRPLGCGQALLVRRLHTRH